MKKTETKPFKDLLLLLRARIRGDVTALADAALGKSRTESSGDLSSMPIHMADIGSDNYEQEFTLGLLQNEDGDVIGVQGVGSLKPSPAESLLLMTMVAEAWTLAGSRAKALDRDRVLMRRD